MQVTEEQIIKEIKDFLGKEGLTALRKNFWFSWGTVVGGSIGMQTRNYLRGKHPELDEQFHNYDDFEDYVTKITLEILKQNV